VSRSCRRSPRGTPTSLPPRFDNPRAPQVRLPGFHLDRLVEVDARVRNLYADGAADPDRIRVVVDDAYLATLAAAVAGGFEGNVGIAPRVFLRKLTGDVLDRLDQFRDFDPRRDPVLTITEGS
jgi:hypothetical protein